MWRPDRLLMALEPLRKSGAVLRVSLGNERSRPRLGTRTSDELSFLPAVLEITETPASPAGRITAATIIGLFSTSLIWASVGQVDVQASATGRVITDGKSKPIAPSETAPVSAIYVADGDHVESGKILVDLDPTGPQTDVRLAKREQQEQIAIGAELRALSEDRDTLVIPDGANLPEDLVRLHQAALTHKAANHRAMTASFDRQRDESAAKVRGDNSDLLRLQETVPMLEERMQLQQNLLQKGLTSRSDYLSTQQEYIDRKQALEGAQHKLSADQAASADLQQRARQAEEKFRGDTLSDLAESQKKAESAQQTIAKAMDRVDLYRLRAPVSGTVQQLSVHAPGAIAIQGQPTVLLVPDDERIVVEASLQNRDSGFVAVGQSVELKIESFPFTRYGTVSGTVESISRDALQLSAGNERRQSPQDDFRGGAGTGGDTETQPYVVRIRLLKTSIFADGAYHELTPGMRVTADLILGKRHLISYLFSPVLSYIYNSARER